jgi:hypothetical protein
MRGMTDTTALAFDLWMDAMLYGNAYIHLKAGRLRPEDVRITRDGYEYRFDPKDKNLYVHLPPAEVKHFVIDEHDDFKEQPWSATWSHATADAPWPFGKPAV